MVEGLRTNLSDMASLRDTIAQIAKTDDYALATKTLDEQFLPILQSARTNSQQIIDFSEQDAANFNDNALATQQTALIIMLVVLAVIIAISILILLLTARSISQPIAQIKDAIEKMAGGDLDIHISYQSRDEMGVLSETIRSFLESLNFMITDIDYCLNEMGNGNYTVSSKDDALYMGRFESLLKSLLSAVQGAHEVADTIDKISSAASEQEISIAQVTQGVTQISSVVQTNSATAEESAAASEELSGQAQMLKGLVGQFKLE